MYKPEDIIEDLKTEKPEVSVWEVIECLEQAQDTISDLEAKVEEYMERDRNREARSAELAARFISGGRMSDA